MNSPTVSSSPTYKNLKLKQIQSPKELKDKIRKDYKNKVQNCRNMLLNRFRGSTVETDLRSTLSNIYDDIFNDSSNECLKSELLLDTEEAKILEEIKQELIQDELDWCLEECEKAQMDNVDWSLLQDDNVICPVCQKNNFTLNSAILLCSFCNIRVETSKPLKEIRNIIFDSIEKHSNVCNNTPQFSAVYKGGNFPGAVVSALVLLMGLFLAGIIWKYLINGGRLQPWRVSKVVQPSN